jgi:small subunit ribosomal protein S20
LANTKSAIKQTRQEPKRTLRNRMVKTKMRTYLKKAQVAVAQDNKEAAEAAVLAAISQIDKAAQKGVIHRNNAARHKARLMKHLNAR